MTYRTHLFRNTDELCECLYKEALFGFPTYALVGTTNNAQLPALKRQSLGSFLVRTLRAMPRSIWVTGASAAGVIQVLSDAINIVNTERTNTREHHVMIGVMPEGKSSGSIADQVKFLFLVKDANDYGDESPYIAQSVSFCGDGHKTGVYLAGGGDITRIDIKWAIAEGLDVIALKGTGRYADEVANNPDALNCAVRIEEI